MASLEKLRDHFYNFHNEERGEGRENIFWIKHKYILLRGINSTQKYTKQNKYKLFMWKTSLGEQEMNGGVRMNERKKILSKLL